MAPIGQKKKGHLGLWITLIVVFVVLVLPISTIYGLFFDGYVKDLGDVPQTDMNTLMNAAVVDLFDDTKSDAHEMNLRITEKQLNGAITGMLTGQLPQEVKPYLTQAYLEIDEEVPCYRFVIALNAYNVFKTRLILKCSLNNEVPDKPGLVFTIDDIIIGRLPGLRDIGHNILKNFLSDAKIADIFGKAGLHIEPHLDEHYIYYPLSVFVNDVIALMGQSGKMALFSTIFKEMLNSHKFKFTFYEQKQIKGALGLLEFHTNPKYCSEEYTLDLGVDEQIQDFMLPLMDNGKFDDDTGKLIENDVTLALKFFVMGSNYILSEDKDKLFPKYEPAILEVLKTKGIDSIEEFNAIRELAFGEKGTPINEVISTKISEAISHTGSTVMEQVNYFINGGTIKIDLNEIELHDVVKTANPVGFTYTFQRKLDSGIGYKLNYMMIDNFYFNMVNGKMYVVFGVNLNGYETSLIITSTAKKGEIDSELLFPLNSDNVYYGNYKCSEDMYSAFLGVIDDAFKGGSSWFKLRGKEAFVFDFTEALKQCSILSQIEASAKALGFSRNVEVSVKNDGGDDINSVGYLELTLGFKKD